MTNPHLSDGVVLIAKPQAGIEPAMLVALFGALLTSAAMIIVKSLSTSEPPNRITFYFLLYGTIFILPFAAVTWQTPNLVQFVWLTLAGFLGAIGVRPRAEIGLRS